MKQTTTLGKTALAAGLVIGVGGFGLVGCATQSSLAPPPSAAQVSATEAAVQVARQAGTDGSPGQHVRLAEQQLAEARDRTARGDNRGAGLALARAEVDAELSQVLRRREKALADAEVMEGQLEQTRNAQPAANKPSSPPVQPLPNTAPPGAVAPGPLPNDPLAGTTVQSATPATSLGTPATSATPAPASPSATPPAPRPTPPPVDPTKNSPPDNKTPTTAPGPSGPGTGIPAGPNGMNTANP